MTKKAWFLVLDLAFFLLLYGVIKLVEYLSSVPNMGETFLFGFIILKIIRENTET